MHSPYFSSFSEWSDLFFCFRHQSYIWSLILCTYFCSSNNLIPYYSYSQFFWWIVFCRWWSGGINLLKKECLLQLCIPHPLPHRPQRWVPVRRMCGSWGLFCEKYSSIIFREYFLLDYACWIWFCMKSFFFLDFLKEFTWIYVYPYNTAYISSYICIIHSWCNFIKKTQVLIQNFWKMRNSGVFMRSL